MQIDRRFLKVAMPQQHLDGSQVSSSFEQMSGKAVTQSMGMDVLVLKTGAFGGLLAGSPRLISPAIAISRLDIKQAFRRLR